jgi:anti-anti-sigma factor
VLILDGEFDRSNAAQFEQALNQALRAGGRHVIADLRGVSFLDSTMLGVLLRGIGHGNHRGLPARVGPTQPARMEGIRADRPKPQLLRLWPPGRSLGEL